MAKKTDPIEMTGNEYQLHYEVENKKERIIELAKHLRGSLDDLVRRLTADGRITNSLGVLQGNGPALDRMIGEYATLVELQKRIYPAKEDANS